MIVPIGASSFSEALKIGNEVFHNLKSILKSRGLSTAVGDEGGFAPNLNGTEDAISTIIEAVNKAGYKMVKDVMIALDCASSEFYKNGLYDYSIFESNNNTKLDSKEQVDFLVELCKKYPKLDEFYELSKNKGYGTAKHIDGIKKYGITKWHRKTFGICKESDLIEIE